MTDQPDSSAYKTLTLEEVVENRNFYAAPRVGMFNDKTDYEAEIMRLSYGIHLIRCELFRLRGTAAGLTPEAVEHHLPHFVISDDSSVLLDVTHNMLRQRVEYLRADLIVAVAAARA